MTGPGRRWVRSGAQEPTSGRSLNLFFCVSCSSDRPLSAPFGPGMFQRAAARGICLHFLLRSQPAEPFFAHFLSRWLALGAVPQREMPLLAPGERRVVLLVVPLAGVWPVLGWSDELEYRAAQQGLCPDWTRIVRGTENVCVEPLDPRR